MQTEVDTVRYLQEVVDEIAYLSVEPDQPLVLDSLMAGQLKWRVDLDLDVDLPIEHYLSGQTPLELARLITRYSPDDPYSLGALLS
jgi:hypothetical protein